MCHLLGMTKQIMRKFKDGFPDNWQSLLSGDDSSVVSAQGSTGASTSTTSTETSGRVVDGRVESCKRSVDLAETDYDQGPVADMGPVANPGPVVDPGPVCGPGPVSDPGPVAGMNPVTSPGPLSDPCPVTNPGPVTNPSPVIDSGLVVVPGPITDTGPITGTGPIADRGYTTSPSRSHVASDPTSREEEVNPFSSTADDEADVSLVMDSVSQSLDNDSYVVLLSVRLLNKFCLNLFTNSLNLNKFCLNLFPNSLNLNKFCLNRSPN